MLCTAYFRISSIWWRAQNETSPANWTKTGQSHARQAGKHHKTPWAWNFELVKLWNKLWNKNQRSFEYANNANIVRTSCEHHANIMRTRWAVLVLPVVRPIGGYHCRLHPALRRDLPNLAPVHRDKPFGDLRRGTWMNLDELRLQSVTYCDYCICILCYNLITTGTLAPRSPFRICGAHCFSIFLHALRFLARSCCVTCSSEKASGRETVQKVRSFRKKDCTCFNTEELHGICEMFQV